MPTYKVKNAFTRRGTPFLPGKPFECDEAEGQRMIAAGLLHPTAPPAKTTKAKATKTKAEASPATTPAPSIEAQEVN